MREVLGMLNQRSPDLEVDGEMHGDAARWMSLFDLPSSRTLD